MIAITQCKIHLDKAIILLSTKKSYKIDFHDGHLDLSCLRDVTQIGPRAFLGLSEIKTMTLPAGVTRIGELEFHDCTLLVLTALPAGVTHIGDGAFAGCTSLALTALPEGVTHIGEFAFAGCTSLALTALPAGVTRILTCVFGDCASLALTALPAGVTSIGCGAFYGCTSLALKEVPLGLQKITSGTFEGCSKITRITVAHDCDVAGDAFPIGCEITRVAAKEWKIISYEHRDNQRVVVTLQSVDSAPEHIKEFVEWQPFRHSTPIYQDGVLDLSRLSLFAHGAVTKIGCYAFSGFKELKSITLPGTVTHIEEGAFSSCEQLTSIELPLALNSIHDTAFSDCKGIDWIVLPRNNTQFSCEVFKKCSRIKVIYYYPGCKPDEQFMQGLPANIQIIETCDHEQYFQILQPKLQHFSENGASQLSDVPDGDGELVVDGARLRWRQYDGEKQTKKTIVLRWKDTLFLKAHRFKEYLALLSKLLREGHALYCYFDGTCIRVTDPDKLQWTPWYYSPASDKEIYDAFHAQVGIPADQLYMTDDFLHPGGGEHETILNLFKEVDPQDRCFICTAVHHWITMGKSVNLCDDPLNIMWDLHHYSKEVHAVYNTVFETDLVGVCMMTVNAISNQFDGFDYSFFSANDLGIVADSKRTGLYSYIKVTINFDHTVRTHEDLDKLFASRSKTSHKVLYIDLINTVPQDILDKYTCVSVMPEKDIRKLEAELKKSYCSLFDREKIAGIDNEVIAQSNASGSRKSGGRQSISSKNGGHDPNVPSICDTFMGHDPDSHFQVIDYCQPLGCAPEIRPGVIRTKVFTSLKFFEENSERSFQLMRGSFDLRDVTEGNQVTDDYHEYVFDVPLMGGKHWQMLPDYTTLNQVRDVICQEGYQFELMFDKHAQSYVIRFPEFVTTLPINMRYRLRVPISCFGSENLTEKQRQLQAEHKKWTSPTVYRFELRHTSAKKRLKEMRNKSVGVCRHRMVSFYHAYRQKRSRPVQMVYSQVYAWIIDVKTGTHIDLGGGPAKTTVTRPKYAESKQEWVACNSLTGESVVTSYPDADMDDDDDLANQVGMQDEYRRVTLYNLLTNSASFIKHAFSQIFLNQTTASSIKDPETLSAVAGEDEETDQRVAEFVSDADGAYLAKNQGKPYRVNTHSLCDHGSQLQAFITQDIAQGYFNKALMPNVSISYEERLIGALLNQYPSLLVFAASGQACAHETGRIIQRKDVSAIALNDPDSLALTDFYRSEDGESMQQYDLNERDLYRHITQGEDGSTKKRVLIIDASSWTDKDLTRLNPVLDDMRQLSGVRVHDDVMVIVLLPVSRADSLGVDFTSRFLKTMSHSQSTVHSDTIITPGHATVYQVPCYGRYWRKTLLAKYVYHAGKLTCFPGKLHRLIEEATSNDEQQFEVKLVAPSRSDIRFKRFFAHLNEYHQLIVQGQVISIPQNLTVTVASQASRLDWSFLDVISADTPLSGDEFILNPTSYHRLLGYYSVDEESGLLMYQAGPLVESAAIRCMLTRDLNADQWHQMQALCLERKVTLKIIFACSSSYFPEQSQNPLVMSLSDSDRIHEAGTHGRALMEEYPAAKRIDISELNLSDLFPHIKNDADKFIEVEGFIQAELKRGSTLILSGQVKPKIADKIIKSLIERQRSGAAKGKLICAFEDMSLFSAMPQCPKKWFAAVVVERQGDSDYASITDKRNALVLNTLMTSPIVVVQGRTGCGKSTFFSRDEGGFDGRSNAFYGYAAIGDWLRDANDSDAYLIIDEANLRSQDHTLFETLFQERPSIYHQGKIHPANKHKVIFICNPSEDSTLRQEPVLFQRHPDCKVVFDSLDRKYYREHCLAPILEDNEAALTAILDVADKVEDLETSSCLITPREMIFMAQLFVQHPDQDVQSFIKSVCSYLLTDAQLTSVFCDTESLSTEQAQKPMLIDKFVCVQSRLRHYRMCLDMLALQRQACKSGLGGLLLEGPPGIGKTQFFCAILKEQGYVEYKDGPIDASQKTFIRVSASERADKKQQKIKLAMLHKMVVVWDELNSGYLDEKLLNEALMQPGFLLLATQNPAIMKGRNGMSPAMQRRLLTAKMDDYSADELKQIFSDVVPAALSDMNEELMLIWEKAKEGVVRKYCRERQSRIELTFRNCHNEILCLQNEFAALRSSYEKKKNAAIVLQCIVRCRQSVLERRARLLAKQQYQAACAIQKCWQSFLVKKARCTVNSHEPCEQQPRYSEVSQHCAIAAGILLALSLSVGIAAGVLVPIFTALMLPIAIAGGGLAVLLLIGAVSCASISMAYKQQDTERVPLKPSIQVLY